MGKDQIIKRLLESNRSEVCRVTGLKYGYLSKVVYGEIKNPGFEQMEKLRMFFQAIDRGRP